MRYVFLGALGEDGEMIKNPLFSTNYWKKFHRNHHWFEALEVACVEHNIYRLMGRAIYSFDFLCGFLLEKKFITNTKGVVEDCPGYLARDGCCPGYCGHCITLCLYKSLLHKLHKLQLHTHINQYSKTNWNDWSNTNVILKNTWTTHIAWTVSILLFGTKSLHHDKILQQLKN